MATVREIGRERVLLCDEGGAIIGGEAAAADLIGEALGEGATTIAVPVGHLSPDFFRLRSGLA
jgi:hypothetical protein